MSGQCQAYDLGPEKTRDGRYVRRRCRRPGTVEVEVVKIDPTFGDYRSVSAYCEKHAPKD